MFELKPVANETLIVRCEPKLRDALQAVAGGKRKLSATVREACELYLEAKGEEMLDRDEKPIKSILVRVNHEGWAELRRLSIEEDTPLDDLLVQAANEMLARKGKRMTVEKRTPKGKR